MAASTCSLLIHGRGQYKRGSIANFPRQSPTEWAESALLTILLPQPPLSVVWLYPTCSLDLFPMVASIPGIHFSAQVLVKIQKQLPGEGC